MLINEIFTDAFNSQYETFFPNVVAYLVHLVYKSVGIYLELGYFCEPRLYLFMCRTKGKAQNCFFFSFMTKVAVLLRHRNW